MDKIKTLSQIFAQYKTFPISKYSPLSPVRVFQRLYPKDHFSTHIEMFLLNHQYEPAQRGADMPWWGAKYFSNESGHRVMIISQDSLREDAGSAVMLSCLFTLIESEAEYSNFIQALQIKKFFRFGSWKRMRDQLRDDWKIDLAFCYITDASKVYRDNSWEDWDFDNAKSKELLEKEIEFCDPGLIILLGTSPLRLLDPMQNFGQAAESGKPLNIQGRPTVVAPFPFGQGPATKNFKKRLEIASRLIKSALSNSIL